MRRKAEEESKLTDLLVSSSLILQLVRDFGDTTKSIREDRKFMTVCCDSSICWQPFFWKPLKALSFSIGHRSESCENYWLLIRWWFPCPVGWFPRPCAWFWKSRGCTNGVECDYCRSFCQSENAKGKTRNVACQKHLLLEKPRWYCACLNHHGVLLCLELLVSQFNLICANLLQVKFPLSQSTITPPYCTSFLFFLSCHFAQPSRSDFTATCTNASRNWRYGF